MRRYTKHLVSYVLIACLGTALLLGQVFKLHMHIQHDENSVSAGHIADVHAAFSTHDTQHNTHHQDDVQNHHLADIKISPDGVVKKAGLFNLFVPLFLITSIFLCVPWLRCIHRQHIHKIKPIFLYYLFHPPLRAPPM